MYFPRLKGRRVSSEQGPENAVCLGGFECFGVLYPGVNVVLSCLIPGWSRSLFQITWLILILRVNCALVLAWATVNYRPKICQMNQTRFKRSVTASTGPGSCFSFRFFVGSKGSRIPVLMLCLPFDDVRHTRVSSVGSLELLSSSFPDTVAVP